jgi:hypothetical protein
MSMAMEASPEEQLLALTQAMLASAEAGDWERLASLEQTRLPLFHQVFAQVVASNAQLARKVLTIDEKTLKLAESGRPALQRELLIMKNSDMANSAYQTVQGLVSGEE